MIFSYFIIFIMTSVPTTSTLLYCEICKSQKEYGQFKQKIDGTFYSQCQPCFFKSAATFWADKKFRQCKTCKVDRPIRKFDFSNGSPYPICRNCYETEYAARRAVERAEKRALVPETVGDSGSTSKKMYPISLQPAPQTTKANGYFRQPYGTTKK